MKNKFFGNQYVSSWWISTKRFVKRLIIVSGALSILGYTLLAGYYYARNTIAPKTVFAEKKVEVPVPPEAPVLDRIAQCESGNTHYKNGQVLIRPNTNGTVDIGRYQINSLWSKKATELGYDLTKEDDNKKMAEWIYLNRGTGDWSASQSCWNK